jgi:rhodanese-related sulfurtransferase
MSRFFNRVDGRKILLEAVSVALLGIALGFVANYLSPRGLGLAHDYFPGRPLDPDAVVSGKVPNGQPAVQPNSKQEPKQGTESPAVLRLKQNGLQMVDAAQIWELYNDPRYQQQIIVFIDARDDRHFAEGHIPGAHQFDHYHPEKFLGTIFPLCQAAEKVVVYCNGGDCEDSEYAAIMLKDAGIGKEKLFVFVGGITEWRAKKHPIETGIQSGAE